MRIYICSNPNHDEFNHGFFIKKENGTYENIVNPSITLLSFEYDYFIFDLDLNYDFSENRDVLIQEYEGNYDITSDDEDRLYDLFNEIEDFFDKLFDEVNSKKDKIYDLIEQVASFYFEDYEFVREDDRLTFYVPEVTIQNENGFEHKITDVYTNIIFRNCKFSQLSITRGSLTQKERELGYVHSHFPRNQNGNLESCCLGSDTPLANFRNKSFEDEVDVITLFDNIMTYLSWESASGGPYIYFSTLYENAFSSNFRTPEREKTIDMLKFFKSDIDFEIDFQENNSTCYIETYKSLLPISTTKFYNNVPLSEYIEKIKTGTEKIIVRQYNLPIMYKGKNIECKVYISPLPKTVDCSEITGNPQLASKINAYLNHSKTTSNEFKRILKNKFAEAMSANGKTEINNT
jgi:hypothetical protein